MENKKRNKPKRRFTGFTDDWEERKLGEIMNVTSVKRIHQSDWTDSGIRFLRARDIVSVARNEEPDEYLYISKEKYNEYSSISGKVAIGDLLVTGVGTIGVPYLIKDSEPLYFKDGNIIWFQNGTKIDGEFFLFSFLGKAIQDFIIESAGIGTVGTYTIESGKKTPICLPKMREQKHVGTFFRNLDHLITLHQRKLDKLNSIKKSYFSEMFPQEGEKKPKRRFKGFTDDWEQHRLGEEVTDMIAGGDIDKNLILEKGRYPVIANALTNEGIVGYYDFTYRIKAPAVTVTGRGDVGHAKARSMDFTPVVRLLTIKSKHDIFFMENSINILRIVVESTGVPQLTVPQLAKYELYFPKTLNEEKVIGKYFHNLDNLITLHQRKYEKLKLFKEAMLNKMFI